MSTIDITRHITKDLEKVIFEKSKKDIQLKERDNYKPYKSDFTEEEWWYFLHTLHDAYVAGANRVCAELNKQADREVYEAQKRAEQRIKSLLRNE
jgi:hypothetical protein